MAKQPAAADRHPHHDQGQAELAPLCDRDAAQQPAVHARQVQLQPVVQDQQERHRIAHDRADSEAGQQQRHDRRPTANARQGVDQRHRDQGAGEGEDRHGTETQECKT